MELVGWSFTGEGALSPLPEPSALPAREASQFPRLGLLHCDRDVADSPYAPVKGSTLDAADVEGWLLGHIHKPDEVFRERLGLPAGSAPRYEQTADGRLYPIPEGMKRER